MRLFTALDLPREIKDYLHSIQQDLHSIGNFSFVQPHNMHITLRFLGDMSDGQYEKVDRALDRVGMEPFTLALSHTGYFHKNQIPKVFWAGFEDDKPVRDLQQRIEGAIHDSGLHPKDMRGKLGAHITLCRFRDSSRSLREELDAFNKEHPLPNIPLSFSSFSLYKSDLSKGMPIYTRLCQYPA